MKKAKKVKPVKSTQVPVTVELLNEVRGELIHRIDKVETTTQHIKKDIKVMKSDIQSLKSNYHGLKGETLSLREEVSELRLEMRTGFSEIRVEIHSLRALIEEQNARNVYVLDALTSLFHRQERLEEKVDRGA